MRTGNHIKKALRNCLALSVILTIMLSQSGLVVWSSLKKLSYNYVREHRAIIGTRDTITLSTTTIKDNNTIVWLEHDEVSYNGNMFDIKFKLKEGNHIRLVGHYDKFENKLFKLLSRLLESGNGNSKNNKINFPSVFTDAILTYAPLILIKHMNIEELINPIYKGSSYSYHKIDSDIKPPEALSA